MSTVVQKRITQKWKLTFTIQSTVFRDWLASALLSFLIWCFQRWRRTMVSLLPAFRGIVRTLIWFFFPSASMKAALTAHACSLLLCFYNSVDSRLWMFVPSYWFLHTVLHGSEKRERGDCVVSMSLSWLKVHGMFQEQKRTSIVEFQAFRIIVEITENLYKACK